MQNNRQYQAIAVPNNKLHKHDLSHQHVTTLDFFRLQPISIMETVAGDKISLNVRSLVEASPLATKVYGSAHLDLHCFFVPFRLLWKEWNNYYYGDGANSSFQLPYVPFGAKGFMDYVFGASEDYPVGVTPEKERRAIFGSLGYPCNFYNSSSDIGTSANVSALPARAYQQIWWDWFRDSVNIPESTRSSYLSTDGGQIQQNQWTTLFAPRYRTFRKDFITTILSPESSGQEGVLIPTSEYRADPYTQTNTLRDMGVNSDGSVVAYGAEKSATVYGRLVDTLRVPVLRGSIALQRFLERLGVTGSRPIERIFSTFGVRPTPERLDMSEFIGYKSIPLSIDGLVNTGSSSKLDSGDGMSPFGDVDNAAFGTMQGRASGGGQTDTWHYNSEEHGYIMVVASIVPDYLNACTIDRLFTRGLDPTGDGNLDFFQPDFDGSNYRPVFLKHVAWPTTSSPDSWKGPERFKPNQLVGYQPYAEDYRVILDRVSGDFLEKASSTFLRNMVFLRNLTDMSPSSVVAGLNLTTPTADDRARFDNHFQVTSGDKDHFILNNFIAVDAMRPISGSQLPTELSDMANRDLLETSKLGIRL